MMLKHAICLRLKHEKRYVHFVLSKTGGRKEQAAQILGINRRTLYRWEKGEAETAE